MKVIKQSYHRNGTAGTGFNVVLFKKHNQKFIAIAFEDTGCIAVFDKDLLDKDVIEFTKNSFRYEDFKKEIRATIKEQQ